MRKKITQRATGFGVIGVIAIVVAIVLIGAVSWKAYDTWNSSQAKTSSNSSPATSKQATTTPPAVTYLDIKELGVKIKLSDDIKDAVYHYDASNPSALTAGFSTQSLISKSSQCDPKESPAFGAITEKQSLTMADGGTRAVDNTTVFQVGSNYFIYSTPQSACTLTPADQAIEASQLVSFKQALTTIQSDH